MFDAEEHIDVVASQTANGRRLSLYQHADALNITVCSSTITRHWSHQHIDTAGKTGQIHVTSYDNLKAAQDAVLAGKIVLRSISILN